MKKWAHTRIYMCIAYFPLKSEKEQWNIFTKWPIRLFVTRGVNDNKWGTNITLIIFEIFNLGT